MGRLEKEWDLEGGGGYGCAWNIFIIFFFLGTKERLEHSRGDVGRECGRFWVRSVGEGRVGKGSQGFFFSFPV